MSEQLLTIFKFALLAVIYLFFFRVLRAVWAEIAPPKSAPAPTGRPAKPPKAQRAPKPGKPRKPPRGSKAMGAAPVAAAAAVAAPGAPVAPVAPAPAQGQLVVVEPAPQRGRTYPVGAELSIGRAAGCQITIDDTYVSQVHARVFARNGNYVVEDLGSTNGTYLNRKKVAGPMTMQRGDRLQVGNTVLELA